MNEESIFLEAVEMKTPETRAEYLDRVCGDNEKLRARVEALLESHDTPDSILDDFPPGLEETAAPPITEKSGMVIGRYKLLQQIGEGGFGVVFMADQLEPVHRKVALKVIKPGMDTKEVIARFEAERQALAMMDHPNIAKVLDAGATDSGRPYFVMEIVKGVSITEYCDKNRLSTEHRLQLFVTACQAVQHAHQKGVIHRDIKPSNIMVTLHDGKPVPKIIDFGVSKAINQQLTEKTLFTAYGQMVGTPQYMSPEQAEMSGLDIDTRSDIYSLGVVLYELLTGTTPLEGGRLRTAGYAEMQRIIREEEPLRPSNRLSTLNTSASIAANRQTDPKKLSFILHGELDWITMKAIEKDRARRYDTANSFAEDVKRHLNDEPVVASPPSSVYRLRKFARRYRVALAVVLLVTMALLIGLAGTAWQWKRARDATQDALANLKIAIDAQQRAESEAREAKLARQHESQQRQRADANFRRARQAVDKYFTLTSENSLLREAGMAPLRKELLTAALDFYEEFSQQANDDPDIRVELAAVHERIAWIYAATGSPGVVDAWERSLDVLEGLLREDVVPSSWHSYESGAFRFDFGNNAVVDRAEALQMAERGIAIFSELAHANPHVVGFRHQLAAHHWLAGHLHLMLGQPKQFMANFQQARHIWERLMHENPKQGKYAQSLSDLYFHLGWRLADSGRQAEGEKVFRDAVATLRAAYGDTRPELAGVLTCLGRIRQRAGASNEAEVLLREAAGVYRKSLENVADRSPRSMPGVRYSLGSTYTYLGGLLAEAGRLGEAEKTYAKAISLGRTLVDQDPTNVDYCLSTAGVLVDLGSLYRKTRRSEESMEYYREAANLLRRLLSERGPGPNAGNVRFLNKALIGLGMALIETGQIDAAQKVIREARDLADIAPTDPPTRLEMGHMLWEQAEALTRLHRTDAAEDAYQKALEVFQVLSNEFPDNSYYHQEVGSSYHYLANMLQSVKRSQEAEEAYRQALGVFQKLSAEFPAKPFYRQGVGSNYHLLANMLQSVKRSQEAGEAYGQALEVFQELSVEFPDTSFYRENMGHALWGLARSNRPEEAVEAYRQALAIFQELSADFPDNSFYRQEVGSSYHYLANMLQRVKRPQEAEEVYRQALDVFQKLSSEFPENALYRREAGIMCTHIGDALLDAERSQEAEKAYESALSIFRSLLEQDANNRGYRRRLDYVLKKLGRMQRTNGRIEKTG